MDQGYLARRYQEEIRRAEEAESATARDAHLALAHQYLAEIERLRAAGDGAELAAAATA